MFEIRKNCPEESLLKNGRLEGLQPQQIPSALHSNVVEKKLEHIPSMVAGLIHSNDEEVLTHACWALSSYLSDDTNDKIKAVIEAGVSPRLVELLSHPSPSVVILALRTFRNIVTGDDVLTQVKPALPALARLIDSNDEEVLTHACWVLSSYLSDGTNDKIKAVIEAGVCPRLVELLSYPSPSVLIPALRTFRNIVTGDVVLTQVKPALPALYRLIHSNDEEVLIDACRALSYLSGGTNDIIKAVIEAGVYPQLVELLSHPSRSVLIHALRTVGNIVRDIVTGDNVLNQVKHAIPVLVGRIHSNDVDVVTEAYRDLSCLWGGTNDKIKDVIGVYPDFDKLLLNPSCSVLIPALRSFRNSVRNIDTRGDVLTQVKPPLPALARVIDSNDEEVLTDACCALSSYLSDGTKLKIKAVIEAGVCSRLVDLLSHNPSRSVLIHALRTVQIIFTGDVVLTQVKPALPVLYRLIHSNDEEVLTEACRALSVLSGGTDDDKIKAVIEADVYPQLVELLWHPSPSVLINALRTVGNIVTREDAVTQVTRKALPRLYSLLTDDLIQSSIKKEACWTISNITAGNEHQIQAVKDADIFDPLVTLLTTADFDVKKEAAWAISNATSGGSLELIEYLVSKGCIELLWDLQIKCQRYLTFPPDGTVTVCLKGLEKMWKVGEANKNIGNTGDVNQYKMID